VKPADAQSAARVHGDVLTAISDGLVALLKEFYGRGPTRTKSYYEDDLVVCLLRGGFTRVEQTLLDGGRGSLVVQQRMEFQELMRERFEAVIERATGRRVIGFMSGNQQDPNIMCEVFILAPTELQIAEGVGVSDQGLATFGRGQSAVTVKGAPRITTSPSTGSLGGQLTDSATLVDEYNPAAAA